MDNEAFILATRVVHQSRKLVGAIDTKKFIRDADYRDGLLAQIEVHHEADLEVLKLAENLKQKLAKLPKTASRKAYQHA